MSEVVLLNVNLCCWSNGLHKNCTSVPPGYLWELDKCCLESHTRGINLHAESLQEEGGMEGWREGNIATEKYVQQGQVAQFVLEPTGSVDWVELLLQGGDDGEGGGTVRKKIEKEGEDLWCICIRVCILCGLYLGLIQPLSPFCFPALTKTAQLDFVFTCQLFSYVADLCFNDGGCVPLHRTLENFAL